MKLASVEEEDQGKNKWLRMESPYSYTFSKSSFSGGPSPATPKSVLPSSSLRGSNHFISPLWSRKSSSVCQAPVSSHWQQDIRDMGEIDDMCSDSGDDAPQDLLFLTLTLNQPTIHLFYCSHFSCLSYPLHFHLHLQILTPSRTPFAPLALPPPPPPPPPPILKPTVVVVMPSPLLPPPPQPLIHKKVMPPPLPPLPQPSIPRKEIACLVLKDCLHHHHHHG